MAQTPYGYRIHNGKAVVDPDEAKRLRTMTALYLDGASIASAAESAGVNRSISNCSRLLGNRLYLGTEYYPPILTEDIVEKVAETRAMRTGSSERKGRKPEPLIPIETRFRMDSSAASQDYRTLYSNIMAEPEETPDSETAPLSDT